MALIVNPRSELIREPNLLIPGKKPNGPVKVDREHPFAPNHFWMFDTLGKVPDLAKNNDFNLVNDAGDPASMITDPKHGRCAYFPADGTSRFMLDQEITLQDSGQWMLTILQKSDDNVNTSDGVLVGKYNTGTNYIWFRKNSYAMIRGASSFFSLTPSDLTFTTWRWYTFLIKGNSVYLYVDGKYEHEGGISGDGPYSYDCVGYAYTTDGYRSHGPLGPMMFHFGEKATVEAAKEIHKDPYQFLVPA